MTGMKEEYRPYTGGRFASNANPIPIETHVDNSKHTLLCRNLFYLVEYG